MEKGIRSHTATRNACKLCTPLGAALAFEGVENSVPLLHGSQGCSTYIRRYMISHFREPVDIASTNFSEETAIFGGGANLKQALDNIVSQYHPDLIGVATTCLSETIGDDVPMFLREYMESNSNRDLPGIIHVSTPSYKGTHADGFHGAIRAMIETFLPETEKSEYTKIVDGSTRKMLNLFPGMVSPEDLRYLKEIASAFGAYAIMLSDYSERLDGALWSEFEPIQEGGTKLSDIKKMPRAEGTIEFGKILSLKDSAGKLLHELDRHGGTPRPDAKRGSTSRFDADRTAWYLGGCGYSPFNILFPGGILRRMDTHTSNPALDGVEKTIHSKSKRNFYPARSG